MSRPVLLRRTTLKRQGGSKVFAVPPWCQQLLGLQEGDDLGLYLDRDNNQMVVKKLKS